MIQEAASPDRDVATTPPTPVLELRGLSAGYGDRPVVHDLEMTVSAGEIVALLGANGAGKSTTLLTVAGELPLSAVRFAGWEPHDGRSAPAGAIGDWRSCQKRDPSCDP